MHRATAVALFGGFVALKIAGAPFASASAYDPTQTTIHQVVNATFGDWVVFTSSAPTSRRCIVANGPFSFQLFADGHHEFGTYFFNTEGAIPPYFSVGGQPNIMSARRIVGHADTYRIRRRLLPKKDVAQSSIHANIVIDDPRMTIEVQSSRDGIWRNPTSLISFLKKEQNVGISFERWSTYPPQTIKTAHLDDVINWCNHNLPK